MGIEVLLFQLKRPENCSKAGTGVKTSRQDSPLRASIIHHCGFGFIVLHISLFPAVFLGVVLHDEWL